MRSVVGHGETAGAAGAGVGGQRPPDAPEVHLALFGKHPAWRDFVAANPAEDNLLTATYEDVYCRCLATLQSGVWGDDLAAVVPHFHHALVRLWPAGDVVIGILVGSADGLGRQQPMMLGACCRRLCYHRAIRSLLPALPGLARRVRLAREAQEVADLLQAAGTEFAGLVRGSPPSPPGHATQVLRALLELPELAASGEGLHRIVYQLVGHDVSSLVGPWEAPRGFADLLPTQVRVGIHTPEPAEAAEQWLTFVRYLCGIDHPLTLFASLGRTWGDLIVGTPTETGLAAILRLPEGEQTSPAEGLEIPAALMNAPEPLTHCVPFSLDEAFRRAIARIRQEAQDAPPEPIACLNAEKPHGLDMKTAVSDIGERVHSALERLGRDRRRDGRPTLAALLPTGRLGQAAVVATGIVLLVLACLLIGWVVRAATGAGAHGGVPTRHERYAPSAMSRVADPPGVSI